MKTNALWLLAGLLISVAAQAENKLPICNIEAAVMPTLQSQFDVVSGGNGIVLRGNPLVQARNLAEAFEKLETLRSIGVCRKAEPNERRNCGLAKVEDPVRPFEITFGGGRVLRGEVLTHVATFDEGVSIVKQLQQAGLCKPAVENRGQAQASASSDAEMAMNKTVTAGPANAGGHEKQAAPKAVGI